MTAMRAGLCVVLASALLLMLGWLAQRRLIYFPDRVPPPPAGAIIDGARDVVLDTSDGLRLAAWYVPPRSPGRDLAVLVANGNGGNRADRAPLALALSGEGFAVLLFDYRGYGGNPGSPSQAGLARDVRAARQHLVAVAGVAPSRLVYFGESLGAAVVTELAAEHPPAALVLRSPFVDLAAVGAAHYPFVPVRALLRDRYPLAEQIEKVGVPTAIVYGTADSIVPPEQSRRVAERAAGPVSVTAVKGADHNDATLLAGPEVIAAVIAVADRSD